MSEQMTCSVCCDAYTKDTRKPVACLSCAYVACTRCVKAFLTSTPAEPNCMNCHHVWDREFLDQHLSRSWREGDLKKHRAAILFDRERSLLPATQPAVEIEVQKRAYAEELPALVEKRQALREQIVVVDDEIARRHFYIRNGRLPGVEAETEASSAPSPGSWPVPAAGAAAAVSKKRRLKKVEAQRARVPTAAAF